MWEYKHCFYSRACQTLTSSGSKVITPNVSKVTSKVAKVTSNVFKTTSEKKISEVNLKRRYLSAMSKQENRLSAYSSCSTATLHSLFLKYDVNGDGVLQETELRNLLKSDFGLNTDETEIYHYLLDKDGDGVISFDELKTWFESDENLQCVRDNTRWVDFSRWYHYAIKL